MKHRSPNNVSLTEKVRCQTRYGGVWGFASRRAWAHSTAALCERSQSRPSTNHRLQPWLSPVPYSILSDIGKNAVGLQIHTSDASISDIEDEMPLSIEKQLTLSFESINTKNFILNTFSFW